MSVMQDIYDSEIGVTIETMWDGGFNVKLGDRMNGYVAETSVDRAGQIEIWLIEKTIEHFPASQFAEIYRDGLSVFQCPSMPEDRKRLGMTL